MHHKKTTARSADPSGVTMIELIIVVAILVTLAGVLMPVMAESKQDSQAAAILNMVDSLRRTANRYYLDNGYFPLENSSSLLPDQHNLFQKPSQDTKNKWKGPYIIEAFHNRQAGVGKIWTLGPPSSGAIYTAHSLATSPGIKPADYLVLTISEVPEGVAKKVNDALDPANETNWVEEGKVVWGNYSDGMSVGSKGSGTIMGGSFQPRSRSDAGNADGAFRDVPYRLSNGPRIWRDGSFALLSPQITTGGTGSSSAAKFQGTVIRKNQLVILIMEKRNG